MKVSMGDRASPSREVDHQPSFDALFAANYRAVVTVAAGLCGNWSDAEEIAQEAFLDLHRSWGRVKRYDKPELWVRRVAVNKGISRYRRAVRERRVDWGKPDQIAADDDTSELARLISALPKRQAQAAVLVWIGGFTSEEAGQILGTKSSSVRTHLERARRALARQLEI